MITSRSKLQFDFKEELDAYISVAVDSSFTTQSLHIPPTKQKKYYTSPGVKGFLYAKQNQSAISDSKSVFYRIKQIKKLVDERKIDPTYLDIPIFCSEKGRVYREAFHKDLKSALKINSNNIRERYIKPNAESIALGIINAVYQLHINNLVHRDINLSNILVYETTRADGKSLYEVKLSDLDETSHASESIKVFKEYIPPEVEKITCNGEVNAAAFKKLDKMKIDAYMLGKTLIDFLDAVKPDGHDESEQLKKIRNIANALINTDSRLSVVEAYKKLFPPKAFIEIFKKLSPSNWDFFCCRRKKNNFDEATQATHASTTGLVNSFLGKEEKAFYHAVLMLQSKYKQTTCNTNEIINASHMLHKKAVDLLIKAYNATPRNQSLINEVKVILDKNKSLLQSIDPTCDAIKRVKLIGIVENAIQKYDDDNNLTARGRKGRYCFWFDTYNVRTIGIDNAKNLLRSISNMESSELIEKKIRLHLLHGKGGTAATSFKTILKEDWANAQKKLTV